MHFFLPWKHIIMGFFLRWQHVNEINLGIYLFRYHKSVYICVNVPANSAKLIVLNRNWDIINKIKEKSC